MADNPAKRVTFNADGQKIVETSPIPGTDLYSRVDVYQGGKGKPDGPGHDHLFFTQNKEGETTMSGGVLDKDRDKK